MVVSFTCTVHSPVQKVSSDKIQLLYDLTFVWYRKTFIFISLAVPLTLVIMAALFMLFLLTCVSGLVSAGVEYKDPHCVSGRQVIVHLFEWKWTDIALECERFLAKQGYCGVQISPPNEHRVIDSPFRPWWQRYQPVSYKQASRSGDQGLFSEMVSRCNAVGVRIYVDAVINHMAITGNSGHGSGGSYFDATMEDFPAVPYYGRPDFNGPNECPTKSLTIENYTSVIQVRNCRLVGLVDLKTGTNYVQFIIAAYFNWLIHLGVAGFRIDASKHMWPEHITQILTRVNNLNPQYFGNNKRPFIYQEVIDLNGNGEPIRNSEYTPTARVTEFNYGWELGRAFNNKFNLATLKTFGDGSSWYLVASDDALAFIDNHDNQRGHGAGGADILTFRKPKQYKAALVFALAHPYGVVRIMSSYDWPLDIGSDGKDKNDWMGPPANPDGSTKDVSIGNNEQCNGGWVCEHRWPIIARMAQFRNSVAGTPLANWWDDGLNKIAFSRGSKGFIAISQSSSDFSETLQTGLAAGTYCDIISGTIIGTSSCSGKYVAVNATGFASIFISASLSSEASLVISEETKIF